MSTKIAIGIPLSWQSVDRNFRSAEITFRSAKSTAAIREVSPDAVFRYYESGIVNLDECRNDIVRRVLSDGCDYLFFIDADVVLPADALARLLTHRLPIVSGVYYKKAYPYPPVNSVWCKDRRQPQGMHELDLFQRQGQELIVDERDRPILRTDLIATDVIGMGCVLIHRDVLEKTGYPWFRYTRDDFRGLNTISEDVWFCKRVAEEGYTVFTDPQVQCGHVMTSVLTDDSWTWYVRENRDFTPEYLLFGRDYFEHPNQRTWSSNRKYQQEVASVVKLLGRGAVLDYGCGDGSLSRSLIDFDAVDELVAFDPSAEARSRAVKKLGDEKVFDGPPENFYDLIICTNVLSMIPESGLPGVLRYFRDHGKRTLVVVNSWEDSVRICPCHVTIHQRPWWDKAFRTAGMVPDEDAEKMIRDLTGNEIDYWVFKPCE